MKILHLNVSWKWQKRETENKQHTNPSIVKSSFYEFSIEERFSLSAFYGRKFEFTNLAL